MGFDEVIAEVIAQLTAAGVPTVDDLRDLNTPGAYVVWDRAEFDNLAGGYTARLVIYAVADNAGRMQSYKQTGPMVQTIRGIWPCPFVEYVDLPIPGADMPLPAWRMPTATIVTFED